MNNIIKMKPRLHDIHSVSSEAPGVQVNKPNKTSKMKGGWDPLGFILNPQEFIMNRMTEMKAGCQSCCEPP